MSSLLIMFVCQWSYYTLFCFFNILYLTYLKNSQGLSSTLREKSFFIITFILSYFFPTLCILVNSWRSSLFSLNLISYVFFSYFELVLFFQSSRLLLSFHCFSFTFLGVFSLSIRRIFFSRYTPSFLQQFHHQGNISSYCCYFRVSLYSYPVCAETSHPLATPPTTNAAIMLDSDTKILFDVVLYTVTPRTS